MPLFGRSKEDASTATAKGGETAKGESKLTTTDKQRTPAASDQQESRLQDTEDTSEPSTSWSRWRGLPQFPNPGKFDDLNRESRECIESALNSAVDGISMELGKVFADVAQMAAGIPAERQFSTSHTISMGSSDPVYAFSTVFVDNWNILTGRWSSEGTIWARYIRQRFFDRFSCALNAQSQPNEPLQVAAELDFQGSNFYTQVKYNSPYVFGLSLVQAITKNFSLGAEGYYNFSGNNTMYTSAFRYVSSWKRMRVPPTLNPPVEPDSQGFAVLPESIWTGMQLNLMNYSLSYTKRFSEKITVSTNYNIGATQEGLESVWGVGIVYSVFKPQVSTARVHVGSDWKVLGILETVVQESLNVTLSALLDHSRRRFRLGVGFSTNIMGE